jgi:micrococcal nuclease
MRFGGALRMKHNAQGLARWGVMLAAALLLMGCDTLEMTPTAPATASTSTPTPARSAIGDPARVVRVVDGDTIVVTINGREERLRYIGIDTPETVRPNAPVECYGREASDANKRLVEGRTVYLVRDVSDRDRHGRLLRYVYVDDLRSGERVFVNLQLVEQGYAQVTTYPPDVRHEQDFRAAQREARGAGRGLWGACST